MPLDNSKNFDSAIKQAMSEGQKLMADTAEHIAPQPLGVQPVPSADQHFDWANRGPDYWAKMLGTAVMQAQTSGGNLGDAVLAVLKHDQQMQSHHARLNNG